MKKKLLVGIMLITGVMIKAETQPSNSFTNAINAYQKAVAPATAKYNAALKQTQAILLEGITKASYTKNSQEKQRVINATAADYTKAVNAANQALKMAVNVAKAKYLTPHKACVVMTPAAIQASNTASQANNLWSKASAHIMNASNKAPAANQSKVRSILVPAQTKMDNTIQSAYQEYQKQQNALLQAQIKYNQIRTQQYNTFMKVLDQAAENLPAGRPCPPGGCGYDGPPMPQPKKRPVIPSTVLGLQ